MSGHPFNFPRQTGQPERSSTEEAEEIPDDEQEQIPVDQGNGEGSPNEQNPIPADNVAAENLSLGQQLEELFSTEYRNRARSLISQILDKLDGNCPMLFLEHKKALKSQRIRFTDEQLLKILNSAVENPAFATVKEELLKLLESLTDMKVMQEEKLKRDRDRKDDDDNNQGGSGIPQKLLKTLGPKMSNIESSSNQKDSSNQKGKESSNQKGEDSSNQKGKESSNQKGEDSSNQKGKESSNQKGEDSSNQKGEDSSNQKGEDSSNQKGKESSNEQKPLSNFIEGEVNIALTTLNLVKKDAAAKEDPVGLEDIHVEVRILESPVHQVASVVSDRVKKDDGFNAVPTGVYRAKRALRDRISDGDSIFFGQGSHIGEVESTRNPTFSTGKYIPSPTRGPNFESSTTIAPETTNGSYGVHLIVVLGIIGLVGCGIGVIVYAIYHFFLKKSPAAQNVVLREPARENVPMVGFRDATIGGSVRLEAVDEYLEEPNEME